MPNQKHIQQIIRFYADCYQADNRELSVANFLKDKIEHQIWHTDPDILLSNRARQPVTEKWNEAIAKTLTLYQHEKDLFTGWLYLAGYLPGRKYPVFAPIILWPSIIEKAYDAHWLVREKTFLLNAFVSRLAGEHWEIFKDKIHYHCGRCNTLFDWMYGIEQAFSEFPLPIDLSALQKLENPWDLNSIKALDVDTQWKLIPAIGTGVIPKSTATRGVLNELSWLSFQTHSFSNPIRAILHQSTGRRRMLLSPAKEIMSPALLSIPQRSILQGAQKYDQTVVIGPPGTGKSFTIAAVAAQYLYDGKSVLIAGKSEQTVQVIADKLLAMGLQEAIIQAGNRDFLSKIKQRLEDLIKGIKWNINDVYSINDLKLNTYAIQQLSSRLENQLIRERGERIFLFSIRSIKLLLQGKLKALPGESSIGEAVVELQNLIRSSLKIKSVILKKYCWYQQFGQINRYRRHFVRMLKALRARTGVQRESLFENTDLKVILKAFPIWLTTTVDVNRVLPLHKGLFDLVIIDEATQCDIATALPILQRGVKSMVVGDPRQLRHLSFLSETQQAQLRAAHHLSERSLEDMPDYRNKSLIDQAVENAPNQEGVIFLDEHYRSAPGIIRFSNEYFYSNALKIMTEKPSIEHQVNIQINLVDGKREVNGTNKKEAEAIVDWLETVQGTEQSVGILSPFREQVEYLRKLIESKIEVTKMSALRLLVDTPHGFQGEERDIVLISFCVDKDSPAGAFNFINRPDVFNVSITRARQLQLVYGSFDMNKLPAESLLRKYLESHLSPLKSNHEMPQLIPTDFQEVIQALAQKTKIKHWRTGFKIAGTTVDLAAEDENGNVFCIDLVGFPNSQLAQHFNLEKLLALMRTGSKFYLLAYRHWQFDRDRVLDEIAVWIVSATTAGMIN